MNIPGLLISIDEGTMRVLTPHDVHRAYVDGLNDPLVNRFLVNVREHRQTRESVDAYIRQNLDSTDSILLGIWRPGAANHCGTVRVHEIDEKSASASIGVCVFDRAAWGQGMGASMIRAVTGWALEQFGLGHIRAGVYGENVASQRSFLNAGYQWVEDVPDRYKYEGKPALVKIYVARDSRTEPAKSSRR